MLNTSIIPRPHIAKQNNTDDYKANASSYYNAEKCEFTTARDGNESDENEISRKTVTSTVQNLSRESDTINRRVKPTFMEVNFSHSSDITFVVGGDKNKNDLTSKNETEAENNDDQSFKNTEKNMTLSNLVTKRSEKVNFCFLVDLAREGSSAVVVGHRIIYAKRIVCTNSTYEHQYQRNDYNSENVVTTDEDEEVSSMKIWTVEIGSDNKHQHSSCRSDNRTIVNATLLSQSSIAHECVVLRGEKIKDDVLMVVLSDGSVTLISLNNVPKGVCVSINKWNKTSSLHSYSGVATMSFSGGSVVTVRSESIYDIVKSETPPHIPGMIPSFSGNTNDTHRSASDVSTKYCNNNTNYLHCSARPVDDEYEQTSLMPPQLLNTGDLLPRANSNDLYNNALYSSMRAEQFILSLRNNVIGWGLLSPCDSPMLSLSEDESSHDGDECEGSSASDLWYSNNSEIGLISVASSVSNTTSSSVELPRLSYNHTACESNLCEKNNNIPATKRNYREYDRSLRRQRRQHSGINLLKVDDILACISCSYIVMARKGGDIVTVFRHHFSCCTNAFLRRSSMSDVGNTNIAEGACGICPLGQGISCDTVAGLYSRQYYTSGSAAPDAVHQPWIVHTDENITAMSVVYNEILVVGLDDNTVHTYDIDEIALCNSSGNAQATPLHVFVFHEKPVSVIRPICRVFQSQAGGSIPLVSKKLERQKEREYTVKNRSGTSVDGGSVIFDRSSNINEEKFVHDDSSKSSKYRFCLERIITGVDIGRNKCRKAIYSICFITGSGDKTMGIFAMDDCSLIRSSRCHQAPIQDICTTNFFTNNIIISADVSGVVVVSSINPDDLQGQPMLTLWQGYTKFVRGLHLSTDGRWLILTRKKLTTLPIAGDEVIKESSISVNHSSLKSPTNLPPLIYPISEWIRLGVGQFHIKPITIVHITKCGRYLLTGGADGTVFVWNLAQQCRYYLSFRKHNPQCTIVSISTSSDSSNVISSDNERFVFLWSLSCGSVIRVLARNTGGCCCRFLNHDFVLVRSKRDLKVFDPEDKLFFRCPELAYGEGSSCKEGLLDVYFATNEEFDEVFSKDAIEEKERGRTTVPRVYQRGDLQASSSCFFRAPSSSSEDEEENDTTKMLSKKEDVEFSSQSTIHMFKNDQSSCNHELHSTIRSKLFLGIVRNDEMQQTFNVDIYSFSDIHTPRYILNKGLIPDENGNETEIMHSGTIQFFTFLPSRHRTMGYATDDMGYCSSRSSSPDSINPNRFTVDVTTQSQFNDELYFNDVTRSLKAQRGKNRNRKIQTKNEMADLPPRTSLFLAATGGDDLSVILWNWWKREPLVQLQHTNFVSGGLFWYPTYSAAFAQQSYTIGKPTTCYTKGDIKFQQENGLSFRYRNRGLICNFVSVQDPDSQNGNTLRVFEVREKRESFRQRVGCKNSDCPMTIAEYNTNCTGKFDFLEINAVACCEGTNQSNSNINVQSQHPQKYTSVMSLTIRRSDSLICTGTENEIIFWRLFDEGGVSNIIERGLEDVTDSQATVNEYMQAGEAPCEEKYCRESIKMRMKPLRRISSHYN